ncbi:MAG: EAL domain-containing protein [Nitrospirae bacterium]|nr:EAL domain-containing protein [Nitrospirota bacterium]
MKVQTKLTALMGVIVVVFFVGLLFLHYSERHRAAALFHSEQQLQERFFDRLVSLKGSSLETFANDYIYWDEMVRFVATGDKRWAADIIDTALPTYQANAAWVYRTDFSVVYAVNNVKDPGLRETPLSQADLRTLFGKAPSPHFFLATPAGLIEIRGASIHPSHDNQRKTPARGYFLVGRVWSDAYVRELSDLTSLTLQVLSTAIPPSRATDAGLNGVIEFSRGLPGWDGTPVRRLMIHGESGMLLEFQHSSNQQFGLLLSFSLAVLIGLSVFLARWVSRPLTLISRSLDAQDGAVAQTLHEDVSEFGHLARLVAQFVEQKQSLVLEVMERERVEHALRESEERYALAARGANEGLWDWNFETDDVYFSPRWKAMLGYEDAQIGSRPSAWFDLVHPDDLDRLTAALAEHRDGAIPLFENEHRMRHNDGSYRWVLSRGMVVRTPSGAPHRMAGSQTDISDRTMHDALTDLPNRALFVDRLQHALLRVQRRPDSTFGVALLDLDRFTLVNDSLGHGIGDQLLIAVARRLDTSLRPGDTVARLGGDEFAVLMEEINGVDGAVRVANRIQRRLAEPFMLNGREVFATATLGIALSETGYDRAEDLLRDADTALHRAKGLGNARYEVFDAAMRVRAVTRLTLETDLRHALERHEFRLQYQPIVSLRSGCIVGFEALMRWAHPDRGLVSPVEFIPVAEETGLIIPIDAWGLREACRQLRTWQDRFQTHPPLTMSVNLSGKQFALPDLSARIEVVLREAGLASGSLKIEITEGVLMENPDAVAATLTRLKALETRISVDDFGTGYSSLSYLHRYPIDTLKIDRSFVILMQPNGGGSEIVRTIITLAHSLGMDVVAEGVETREQLDRLTLLGCEYGQGYYFSKPITADAATALLDAAPRWSQAA